jgi:hypothetical protein
MYDIVKMEVEGARHVLQQSRVAHLTSVLSQEATE